VSAPANFTSQASAYFLPVGGFTGGFGGTYPFCSLFVGFIGGLGGT